MEIGEAANQYLALDAIDATDFYEKRGSGDADNLVGTRKADFLYGLQGDDILWGSRDGLLEDDPGGPDALSGGSGNDILRGGGANDVLRGGPGNDIIIAGDAIGDMGTQDTARFEGLSSEYQIIGGQTYSIVTGSDGSRDKVFGVQYLRFDNEVIELGEGSALDGAGDPEGFVVAERVALLYEAALNRDGDIDLPGLNFYIGVTETNNLSDEFLAQDLMTSPEFTANFGNANTLSNSDFLEQIYLNVLDRPSDAAGRQFYLDLLNEGTISKALALADIAISPENTTESRDILMGLYENSAGDWSFI